MSKKRVCIIGAGIAGLSTAYAFLAKHHQNVDVTIVSKDFEENTTSWVAAGVQGAVDTEKKLEWARKTKRFLLKLLNSGKGEECGIYWSLGYKIYVDCVKDFRKTFQNDIIKELTKEEVENIFPHFEFSQFKSAYLINALFCNPMVFLPYLHKQIQDMGGKFIQKEIHDISELHEFDCIVNCAGLGARNLVKDDTLHAVRGQVTHVKAPSTHFWYELSDEIYGFPSTNGEFKVGGCYQLDNTSIEVDEHMKYEMLSNAYKLHPTLRSCTVIKDYVGLRPYRVDGPRVELEKMVINNRTVNVVHNYGHGARGWSLFWGCSNQAVDLGLTALLCKTSNL